MAVKLECANMMLVGLEHRWSYTISMSQQTSRRMPAQNSSSNLSWKLLSIIPTTHWDSCHTGEGRHACLGSEYLGLGNHFCNLGTGTKALSSSENGCRYTNTSCNSSHTWFRFLKGMLVDWRTATHRDWLLSLTNEEVYLNKMVLLRKLAWRYLMRMQRKRIDMDCCPLNNTEGKLMLSWIIFL